MHTPQNATLTPATANAPPPAARFLSPVTSARYCGMSRRTMDYLKAEGKLPFVKVGKRILFDRADLDRFMLSRRVDCVAEAVAIDNVVRGARHNG